MSNQKWKTRIVVVLAVLAAFCIWAWRDFQGFCERSVPIFAYHRVEDKSDLYSMPPEDFEQQMAYLQSKGYKTIKLGTTPDGGRQGIRFTTNAYSFSMMVTLIT